MGIRTFLRISALLATSLLLTGCLEGRDDYETATYTVAKQDREYEIRDYPELKTVVTSTAQKDGEKANNNGQFMQLFRYISGENANKSKIAMTTPVFMDRSASEHKMSFVLPAAVAKAEAPAPKNTNVKLEAIPARKMAVIRYSGAGNQENEKAHESKLREWMKEQGLEATGDPVVAYYDPPFTPLKLRRNEVLIPVK